MAHIEVTEEELATGRFPPVCAKTGEPTTTRADLSITIMPRWSRILLVLGVLPWFVARPLIGRRLEAKVPLLDSLASRRARSRADLVAAMFGGLLATAFGSLIPRDDLQVGLVGVGFVIVVGTVVALAYGERDYGVDLRPTPWDTVEMRRIHPRFRDALVRGQLPIGEPSVGEIVTSAQAASQAPDPWE